MNWKFILTAIVGTVLVLLGILWFLQGSDIVHLNPILCFAECEPIVGTSPQWQYSGVIAFIIGVILIGLSVKRIKH